jgi:hypothetical protein
MLGRRHFAFVDEDNEHWDCANALNESALGSWDDPWRGRSDDQDEHRELRIFWNSLEPDKKAWFEVTGVIKLEDILEVDEIGDEITEHPHIFVRCFSDDNPFSDGFAKIETISSSAQEDVQPLLATRIVKFPEQFRKPFPPRRT